MSIKIYNGYIARNTTIDAMYPALLEANDYVRGYLERQTLRMSDSLRSKPDYNPLKLRGELERLSRSSLDADSSIALFPDQGDVLAMVFSGRNIERLYAAKVGLEPFYYFNNTDWPEELSEEEWDERLVRWARVTRDFKPTNQSALILENSVSNTLSVIMLPQVEQDKIRNRSFPEVDDD